ncbi:MAG: hypothetical protein AAF495_16960 [Pseudomonadota bacterium]
MRSFLGKPIHLSMAGLGVALVMGLGLAQPSQAATVQNLYEAIYVEQICSGHEFTEDEWGRLVDRVRILKGQGYEGEETLFTMVKAKSAAKDLTRFSQCSSDSVASVRSIYANDLASAL